MDHQNWTSCEMYGHRYEMSGEQFATCTDCGEPRDEVDESPRACSQHAR